MRRCEEQGEITGPGLEAKGKCLTECQIHPFIESRMHILVPRNHHVVRDYYVVHCGCFKRGKRGGYTVSPSHVYVQNPHISGASSVNDELSCIAEDLELMIDV